MSGLSDVNAEEFFSFSTCCAIGEKCFDHGAVLQYGDGCKDVFPGYIVSQGMAKAMTGTVSCGGLSCGLAMAPSLMHELGHAVRLGHGPPELDTAHACQTDLDCFLATGEHVYCVAGYCMVKGHRLPNHVSSMSYSYGRVDALGRLDYSSGLRPTLPVMQDVGPCDAACITVSDPACRLPAEMAAGLLPTDPCCYDDRCIDGGLDESTGIGDLYGAGGNDYLANRDFQLSTTCDGVEALYENEALPGLDWDGDSQPEVTPVSRALFNSGQCFSGGPGNGYFHPIPDIDEWAFVDQVGFSLFGINLVYTVGSNGYCGADEGVFCPPGYPCERGFCRTGWIPGLPVDYAGLDEP